MRKFFLLLFSLILLHESYGQLKTLGIGNTPARYKDDGVDFFNYRLVSDIARAQPEKFPLKVVLSDAPVFTDYFITFTQSEEREFACLFDKKGKVVPKRNTNAEWCGVKYSTTILKIYKQGKLAKIITDTTGQNIIAYTGLYHPDFAISEGLAWIQHDLGVDPGEPKPFYPSQRQAETIPIGVFDMNGQPKKYFEVYKPYLTLDALKYLKIVDKEEKARQMQERQDSYNARNKLMPLSKEKINEVREYFPGYRRNFVKENQQLSDKFLSGENFLAGIPAQANAFDEFEYYMRYYEPQVYEATELSMSLMKFIDEFDDGTLKSIGKVSKQPGNALYLWQIAYDFELAGEMNFAAVLYLTVLDNSAELNTSLPVMHTIRLKSLQGLKRVAQKRNMPLQASLVDLCASLTQAYLESSIAQKDEDDYRKDLISIISTTQESYEAHRKAQNKALWVGLASLTAQAVGTVADAKTSDPSKKMTDAEKKKLNSTVNRNINDVNKRADAVSAGVKDVVKDINTRINQVNSATDVSDVEVGRTFVAPVAMYFLDMYDQLALPIFESFSAKYPDLATAVKSYKKAVTEEEKESVKLTIQQNLIKLEILSAQYERVGKPIPKLKP